jgi:uncharacterized protein YjbI with pentapeptide repeats
MRHLFRLLYKGAEGWNNWRKENPDIELDFSGQKFEGALKGNLYDLDFSRAKFHGAKLSAANARGASFSNCELWRADFTTADLQRTDFSNADLYNASCHGANLVNANLTNANLTGVTFWEADLTYANLSGANLTGALFGDTLCVGTNFSNASLRSAGLRSSNFSNADFSNCEIYGIAVWDIDLDGAIQNNLRITSPYHGVPSITVDNLEAAQFIHLLVNNEKIRDIITTITSKAVLILGRFTEERKAVLDAIRDELRRRDYLPIMFDFERPSSRDLTETISTLAHMSRFIIADITDPRSIPQELQAIIPHLPSVPVKPLLLASENENGMFEHFKRYGWVLETHVYESSERLIADLKDKVIAPAEAKANELRN